MKRQLDNYNENPRRSKRASVVIKRQNNYPYVLTIIDMQPKFSASNNQETIDAVSNLINNAKRDGAYIVYAQYMRCGKSNDTLVKLTNGYKNRCFVVANKNDKSEAVMTKIITNKIRTNIMKICGVNTDACVKATVEGISEKLSEWTIQVVKDACNSCDNQYSNYAYKEMDKLKNVILH